MTLILEKAVCIRFPFQNEILTRPFWLDVISSRQDVTLNKPLFQGENAPDIAPTIAIIATSNKHIAHNIKLRINIIQTPNQTPIAPSLSSIIP